MKVESVLDEAFFTRIGKYVATCAHIEKWAWGIVAHTEGFDLDSEKGIDALLTIQKNTSDLRKKLGDAAEQHPSGLKSRIAEVADRIEASTNFRNMVVHGQWVWQSAGQYKVSRYKKKKKDDPWKALVSPIPVKRIDAELAEADGILSELMSIYKDAGFP